MTSTVHHDIHQLVTITSITSSREDMYLEFSSPYTSIILDFITCAIIIKIVSTGRDFRGRIERAIQVSEVLHYVSAFFYSIWVAATFVKDQTITIYTVFYLTSFFFHSRMYLYLRNYEHNVPSLYVAGMLYMTHNVWVPWYEFRNNINWLFYALRELDTVTFFVNWMAILLVSAIIGINIRIWLTMNQ